MTNRGDVPPSPLFRCCLWREKLTSWQCMCFALWTYVSFLRGISVAKLTGCVRVAAGINVIVGEMFELDVDVVSRDDDDDDVVADGVVIDCWGRTGKAAASETVCDVCACRCNNAASATGPTCGPGVGRTPPPLSSSWVTAGSGRTNPPRASTNTPDLSLCAEEPPLAIWLHAAVYPTAIPTSTARHIQVLDERIEGESSTMAKRLQAGCKSGATHSCLTTSACTCSQGFLGSISSCSCMHALGRCVIIPPFLTFSMHACNHVCKLCACPQQRASLASSSPSSDGSAV